MTKFSNKLKKPCFGPVLDPFSQFWGKKKFPENPALSRTTSYEFVAPCQISEKTNDTIPRKHLDRRTEGQKHGPTLFYRTLLATAGGPKSSLFFRKDIPLNMQQFNQQTKLETVLKVNNIPQVFLLTFPKPLIQLIIKF